MMTGIYDRANTEYYKGEAPMAGRILLVEPDVVLGAVLGEVLRQSGYEVIFVRTLEGQAERIHSVSAVILDLDTVFAERELAWLDLLRSSFESLPIVLLGLYSPEDLHHHPRLHVGRRQAEHLAWVQKPFRNDELLAAVRRVNGKSLVG
jgi:DNA-binding response OmpR family regulator